MEVFLNRSITSASHNVWKRCLFTPTKHRQTLRPSSAHSKQGGSAARRCLRWQLPNCAITVGAYHNRDSRHQLWTDQLRTRCLHHRDLGVVCHHIQLNISDFQNVSHIHNLTILLFISYAHYANLPTQLGVNRHFALRRDSLFGLYFAS